LAEKFDVHLGPLQIETANYGERNDKRFDIYVNRWDVARNVNELISPGLSHGDDNSTIFV
jgi:hypothetical protein